MTGSDVVFTGAYPPGHGPQTWAQCVSCGQHDYAHAPGCELRPVLRPVRGLRYVGWQVSVAGQQVGVVARLPVEGARRACYIAVDLSGRRMPASRGTPIWRRGHAVNALVRAAGQQDAAVLLPEPGGCTCTPVVVSGAEAALLPHGSAVVVVEIGGVPVTGMGAAVVGHREFVDYAHGGRWRVLYRPDVG